MAMITVLKLFVWLLTMLHAWVQPYGWGGGYEAHAVQHTLSM